MLRRSYKQSRVPTCPGREGQWPAGRIRISLRLCETTGHAHATARRQRSYRGGIDRNEATSHQIRAGSLVDPSDCIIGRRGDLFRVSHARLLSNLSANAECQRRSIERAGAVSIFDYHKGFGGPLLLRFLNSGNVKKGILNVFSYEGGKLNGENEGACFSWSERH